MLYLFITVTYLFLFKIQMFTSERDNPNSKSFSLTQYFQDFNTPNIKPKSSQRNEAHIYDLKQIGTYYENNRPKLSPQRRRIIQQKLQLDKKAVVMTKERIKDQNMFIKYEHNPFSHLGGKVFHQHSPINEGGAKTVQTYERLHERGGNYDIVDAVNKIQDNNFIHNFKQFNRQRTSKQQLSSNIKQQVNKLNYNMTKSINNQNKYQHEIKETTIDDIVAMEDDNYYTTNQKPFNIFNFIYGDDDNILCNRVLDKYYFNFTSMIDKIKKIKVPTYRQLSRVGRQMMYQRKLKKQSRLDMISSHQMTFKLSDLRYVDLMSISSGRFTSDIVYITINQGQIRKQASPNSSQIDDTQIIYNQNSNQFMLNFSNQDNSKQQIIDYLKLQNTPVEDRYTNKCNKIYHNVSSKLQQRMQLCQNTINDNQIHRGINKNINDDIQYFLEMDKNKDQTDRLIRTNKNNKNRRQNIKIRKLLDTIIIKNQQQDKIRQLLNPNPK